jgi:HD-GYP domain-containing protein (c-di-GMP phosphodiesterase class II)
MQGRRHARAEGFRSIFPAVPPRPPIVGLRLIEPLAALSLATDLARGHQAEEAIRACLVAARIRELAGVPATDARAVFYTTIIRYVGCTASSHEYASRFGGDDIYVRRLGDMIDSADPLEVLPYVLGFGRGAGLPRRGGAVVTGLTRGPRIVADALRGDCEVAARLTRRFGLGDEVAAAVSQGVERWDGKGAPGGLRGDAISLAARISALAYAAVMFLNAGGPEMAEAAVGRWSGHLLDPGLADLFLRHRTELLEAAAVDDAWTALLSAEPAPSLQVSETRLDEVATGFAESADLKSVYLHGHSTGVAALAERAASVLGMSEAEVRIVRRAALLHDLGRVAVPTRIWDKPGPLNSVEWEQVRLHPYHTERILTRAAGLSDIAGVAGMHHERLDGHGYPRGAPPSGQSAAARVLAAADAYHALGEDRPHRPAIPFEQAAGILQQESLDREAVAAVLESAGQRRPTRTRWPAGLTGREVEVLRLLVRGLSMRQIAGRLHISTSTVHAHTAHVYDKAGVSTRAAAALFAVENDLLQR